MSEPGFGAMLHYLSGGSANDPKKYYGKVVESAQLVGDDRLRISFVGGPVIELWDNGQSCCEKRYLTCDDDPADLNGQGLVSIEAVRTEERDDNHGDPHEMVFVKVQGDRSAITLCAHNKHNGYYGGFGLTITESKIGE